VIATTGYRYAALSEDSHRNPPLLSDSHYKYSALLSDSPYRYSALLGKVHTFLPIC